MSRSKSSINYLLDANPFIEAKDRYYRFEICPGFWKAFKKTQDQAVIDRFQEMIA